MVCQPDRSEPRPLARLPRRLDDLGKSLAARFATRIPSPATGIGRWRASVVPLPTPADRFDGPVVDGDHLDLGFLAVDFRSRFRAVDLRHYRPVGRLGGARKYRGTKASPLDRPNMAHPCSMFLRRNRNPADQTPPSRLCHAPAAERGVVCRVARLA